jgi:integrase
LAVAPPAPPQATEDQAWLADDLSRRHHHRHARRVREKHLLIQAGIPDGVEVDLSLIRLPPGALMFPAVPVPGEDFNFARPRNPRNFSKEFARRAGVIGFGSTRFHDLRGIHTTALLDAGIPVRPVAQRIGDDPAVVLRNYAKRKRIKTTDANLADAIGKFAAGFLNRS